MHLYKHKHQLDGAAMINADMSLLLCSVFLRNMKVLRIITIDELPRRRRSWKKGGEGKTTIIYDEHRGEKFNFKLQPRAHTHTPTSNVLCK